MLQQLLPLALVGSVQCGRPGDLRCEQAVYCYLHSFAGELSLAAQEATLAP